MIIHLIKHDTVEPQLSESPLAIQTLGYPNAIVNVEIPKTVQFSAKLSS